MSRILSVALQLGVLVYLAPTAMGAKCKAAPKSVQNVPSCCHAPMPNWGAYASECSSSGTEASCRLACIFNVTGALQGNQLNLSQGVPTMLQRAFHQNETIETYNQNFAFCAALVRSKYKELAQVSKQSDACDRHALFYSLCAYSRLMRHCPASHWSARKECQTARAYVRSCPWPALKMFMKNT